jgi:hypothetical protein
MLLTVGQALLLVRGALEAEPQNLARNHSLQVLGRLERILIANPRLSEKALAVPLVEPTEDFGKSSGKQSEPEEELDDVEDAPNDEDPLPAARYRKSIKKEV